MSSMNEMERFAQGQENGGDETTVALEGTDASAPEAEVAQTPGVSKKQKQMVLGGAGLGVLLLVGLLFANMGSGGGDQQQMAQYDQVPAGQAQQQMDPGGVLAMPHGGAAAAPLIGDQEQESPGTAPVSIGSLAGVSGDPSSPVPLTQMMGQGVGNPSASGNVVVPSAPATASAQMAPAPVAPAPISAITQPVLPAQVVQAAVVSPSVPAPIAGTVTTPVVSASEASLRGEVVALKAEVAELKRQLGLEKQRTTPKPQAPVARAKPAPAQPAAATPQPPLAPEAAAAVARRAGAAVPSVSVKAADLKSSAAPRAEVKNSRSDFTIYAVTDGRVWVVGKDGERLGPLAVGSPLTDGSKITGIDVGRGVVLTSGGEIH